MFQSIKNGWQLIKESFKAFNRHPKFIIPLLITWLVYAPIILYLKYWFNWDLYTEFQVFLILLGIIFAFAFLLSFSCSILLELIQQLESGKEIRVLKAIRHTIKYNIIKILPVIFVWTIIWFILLVIQVLLSRSREREKESFSAENAAKTLAGYQKFSLSKAFFKAIGKGVRMIVFLILPAIAWENLSFWKSVKKGIAVFKSNLSVFVTGFILTGFASVVMFLPPAVLFFISGELEVAFPGWVWIITIIYIAFAWSYSIYLEQMFTAELYLWNYKWEKEVAKAQAESRPIPKLNDIPKPSILDEVNDLL
jgi:hypothetical protein